MRLRKRSKSNQVDIRESDIKIIKPPSLKDEERLRDKEVELEKQIEKDVIIEKVNEKEREEIVGLAKPMGFWTGLIMSKNINFLISRIGTTTKDGGNFWANLIQSQEGGKKRGGGRKR
ncbi:hypothetical protein [Candidatus Cyrtobacter comes]|uniref:hypothetical protein n=1 Tax=Candidatus Cyrtobacter comes TaxID=675776 RepID=UPI002ACD7073|nr:hypothetical protein [Candidatus Cyrtobacter comes]